LAERSFGAPCTYMCGDSFEANRMLGQKIAKKLDHQFGGRVRLSMNAHWTRCSSGRRILGRCCRADVPQKVRVWSRRSGQGEVFRRIGVGAQKSTACNQKKRGYAHDIVWGMGHVYILSHRPSGMICECPKVSCYPLTQPR